ncbi:hypothetical protein ACHAWF_007643 [Thalassiosira exigua]
MVMGEMDHPAFLACRSGRAGPAAIAGAAPRLVPTLPVVCSWPLSHARRAHRDGRFANGSSPNLSGFPSRVDSSRSTSSNRARGSAKKNSIGKKDGEAMPNGCARRTAKHSVASFLSLSCALAVLLGTPRLDGIEAPGGTTMNFQASALETASKSDELQSSPAWASSSSLSDRLFKSMSERDSAKASTSPPNRKLRYWDAQAGSADQAAFANEKLIDHAVATISTMYYDSSGGFNFDAQEFYAKWKKFRYSALHPREGGAKEKKDAEDFYFVTENGFAARDDAVKTLKSIVASLHDPYSKYLTREELRMELEIGDDGFLGLGAVVDAPVASSLPTVSPSRKSSNPSSSSKEFDRVSNRPWYGGRGGLTFEDSVVKAQFTVPMPSGRSKASSNSGILSVKAGANLPVITAIIPDSPAERAGLVVGDRIVSVGVYQFTGMSRSHIKKALVQKFHAENYFGRADLTIAKQVMGGGSDFDANGSAAEEKYVFENGWYQPNTRRMVDSVPNDVVLGYKLSHVKRIPTMLTSRLDGSASSTPPAVIGGDSVVHYELLTPSDSIFQQIAGSGDSRPVGYIRLTRFSKTSTAGYINAIQSLEEAGAQSYIIDLRNNYGGVIQEAMLTTSTLLRDPHSVLCYTLNSRGGFKPQENMEYVVDPMYPGYLLSSESSSVSRDQVRREHPEYLEDGGWTAPTSYASLRELRMTRGIKPAHLASSFNGGADNAGGFERPAAASIEKKEIDLEKLADVLTRNSQKKVAILINEGTGKHSVLGGLP